MQVPELKDKSGGLSISTVDFNETDIENRLKQLNPNKSPGPDGIIPRVLLESAKQLSSPSRNCSNHLWSKVSYQRIGR